MKKIMFDPPSRPFLLWTMVYGLWTAVAIGLGWAAAAQAHSEEATVCIRTYTPITVDGKLDDWGRRLEGSNWTGQMQTKKGEVQQWMRAVPAYLNPVTSRVEAGTVSGVQDFSAVIYTFWDPEQFYVAAIVTDDEVIAQHEGEDIWQDDGLEVWFDCRHDALTHTLFQDDEYQLGFSPAGRERSRAAAWAWRNPRTERVIPAMAVASALTATGYVLEGKVPWSVLQGCHPTIGSMMGFNLSMVDKDADQLWTHVTWSGQLHSDPSQFGHLFFVDAPIDIFPSDVFESSPGRSGKGSPAGGSE